MITCSCESMIICLNEATTTKKKTLKANVRGDVITQALSNMGTF